MKEPLLFLVHRLPYPPNKGDKIRSWHLLKFLATHYQVHLGAFIDDPADRAHAHALDKVCVSVKTFELNPRRAKLASLRGLASGEALTLPYYRHAEMARWVNQTIAAHGIRTAVAFSSAMAQYVPAGMPTKVMDMVDVDSDKWAQYAPTKPWPLSWLYRREAAKLGEWETRVASEFGATLLVSEAEAAHLKHMAPASADRIGWFENGVDAAYFSPDSARVSPYVETEIPLVFTGAMDYWPNIDAVVWFATEILPRVREALPNAVFTIVGSNPAESVKALAARPGVRVTGRVEDVRPYVQHAACAVAPLRLARGVQNKVLEAMAMSRPVVASPQAAEGISAQPGEAFLVAKNAAEFASRVVEACRGQHPQLALAARARILQAYDWQANLSRILPCLQGKAPAAPHENSTQTS